MDVNEEPRRILDLEREALRAKLQTDRAELESVERALARLDQETYGCCVGCGRRIEPLRLVEKPQEELCMGCDAFMVEPTWSGYDDGPYW